MTPAAYRTVPSWQVIGPLKTEAPGCLSAVSSAVIFVLRSAETELPIEARVSGLSLWAKSPTQLAL